MPIMDVELNRIWLFPKRLRDHALVLPMPATSALPGVPPLHHPALRQGRNTLWACWTCLDGEAPAWTGLRPPSLPSVLVLLLIGTHRDKTRQML